MIDVRSIKKEQTYEWLLKKHYAKRVPNIMYAFGLFEANILVGIITYGMPPSNALCVGICGIEFKSEVIELNRLCVESDNRNASSMLISQSLKMLPKPSIVVSYADTSMGHIGIIYQATNWIYTGLSAKRSERYDINNPNAHSRWSTSEMAMRERPRKHRYVYLVGTKRQKKERLKALNYPIMPYPKGESKKYDASYKPTIQMELF